MKIVTALVALVLGLAIFNQKEAFSSNCWEMTNNVALLLAVPGADSPPPSPDPHANDTNNVGEAHVTLSGNTDAIAMARTTSGDCGYKGGTTNSDTRYPTGSTFGYWYHNAALFKKNLANHGPVNDFVVGSGGINDPSAASKYVFSQVDDSNGNPLCKLLDPDGVQHWFYKICVDADGQ